MPAPSVVPHAKAKIIVVTSVALIGAVCGTYLQKMFEKRFADDVALQAKRIVDLEEEEERQKLAAAESVNIQQRKS